MGMWMFCALMTAKVRISSPLSSGSTVLGWAPTLVLQHLAGVGRPLDVVGVGVRGDKHFAGGQVEIHLADQLDDLVHGFQIANVDEGEFRPTVDEVDVDAEAPAGLVVHLDDVGKEVLPRQHGTRPGNGISPV